MMIALFGNMSSKIFNFLPDFRSIVHRYPTLIVTLATKDEASRGVAKACLLSVADVGTILQVVVKPRKPR